MDQKEREFIDKQIKKLTAKEHAGLLEKIGKTARWRAEIEEPEFVASKGYDKSYLNIAVDSSISQAELYVTCSAVNAMFSAIRSDLRVNDHMGEIIPAHVVQNHTFVTIQH